MKQVFIALWIITIIVTTLITLSPAEGQTSNAVIATIADSSKEITSSPFTGSTDELSSVNSTSKNNNYREIMGSMSTIIYIVIAGLIIFVLYYLYHNLRTILVKADASMDKHHKNLKSMAQMIGKITENTLNNQKLYENLIENISQHEENLQKITQEFSLQFNAQLEQMNSVVPRNVADQKSSQSTNFTNLEKSVNDIVQILKYYVRDQILSANQKIVTEFFAKQDHIIGKRNTKKFYEEFKKFIDIFNAVESIQDKFNFEEPVKSVIDKFITFINNNSFSDFIHLYSVRENINLFIQETKDYDFNSMSNENFQKTIKAITDSRQSLLDDLKKIRLDSPANTSDFPGKDLHSHVIECLDAVYPKMNPSKWPQEILFLKNLAAKFNILVMPIIPDETPFKLNYHEDRGKDSREDLNEGIITAIIRHGFTNEKGDILQTARVKVNSPAARY